MADLKLVIGNKNYSSWSLRAWIGLAEAGLAFDEVVLPLDTPEFAEKIPTYSGAKRVPVLIHGDLTVWDSLAILEYVADLAPEAGLLPDDGQARAVARCVAAEMHAGFAPLRRALPMNLKRPPRAIAIGDAVADDIARIQHIWLDCRDRYGDGGDCLFGGFTIADAMFAPVASRFATYQVPLDPVCAAYRDSLLNRPSFQRWQADGVAEAWVNQSYDAL